MIYRLENTDRVSEDCDEDLSSADATLPVSEAQLSGSKLEELKPLIQFDPAQIKESAKGLKRCATQLACVPTAASKKESLLLLKSESQETLVIPDYHVNDGLCKKRHRFL